MIRVAVRPRASNPALRLLLISAVLAMLLSLSATSVVGQGDPPDLVGTWSGQLALPTGAWFATDADGRISRMNPVAEELSGCSSDAAVGRALSDVLRLSQRHLFDLMTGSDEYVPIEAPKPARDLVEVLFPKLNPTWWPMDTV